MTHTPEHRAKAMQRLSYAGKKFFPMIEFDPDEELVMEIKKHPFGIVAILTLGITVALSILIVAYLFSFVLFDPSALDINEGAWQAAIFGLGFVLAGLVVIIMFFGIFIYRNNVIFVTTEKLAQVIYTTIISRKISQLSIGDVQDVTVHQNGIFARIFHYGTLVIETAGEQQNYTFTFVPDPHETANQIINAHEQNLRLYGN